MHTTHDIILQLQKVKITFGSITYTTKTTGEQSRYTLILGASYNNLLEKSLLELKDLLSTFSGLDLIAAQELKDSLENSIEAHANGRQNASYTKAGMYERIVPGVMLNTNDNTLQLFGLLHTKKVLVPGVYRTKNSAPKTLAKERIRKMLSYSRFREFALDHGHIHRMKINGETLEIE
jgi:hypothetical protein